MQLPTHIIQERKLHFIAYELFNLFSMIPVNTQRFKHLNKVDVWANIDSELEEQRSVIRFLISEGKNPFHIFKSCRKVFKSLRISRSTFYS